MKLTYLGHSGFAVEGDSFVAVIDYCSERICGTSKQVDRLIRSILSSGFNKNIYVLLSHSHGDHFNPDILEWAGHKAIRYIFSDDISLKNIKEEIILLNKGGEYKDSFLKVKGYGSTDIGISFYIEADGKRIFHAGDLNNWHWNEEYGKLQALECERHYLEELRDISEEIQTLDLLMFPTDPRLGKDYLLGARQFIEKVAVRFFAPMHFWNDYGKAFEFSFYAEEQGVNFINLRNAGDTFEF